MKTLLTAVAAATLLLSGVAAAPTAYAQEKGKRDDSKGKAEEKGKSDTKGKTEATPKGKADTAPKGKADETPKGKGK